MATQFVTYPSSSGGGGGGGGAVTQSGTWVMRTQDGSGNAITSTALGSKRGLDTHELGKTSVTSIRNDYTSTSVTTSAWVEIVASLSADVQEIEIFDSSGQTLELGVGGSGSEARQLYILPGGNGKVPLRIASGARVSVKAASATASVGELVINFYS